MAKEPEERTPFPVQKTGSCRVTQEGRDWNPALVLHPPATS